MRTFAIDRACNKHAPDAEDGCSDCIIETLEQGLVDANDRLDWMAHHGAELSLSMDPCADRMRWYIEWYHQVIVETGDRYDGRGLGWFDTPQEAVDNARGGG